MLIATEELQRIALVALIQQLQAMNVDLSTAAEGAKLRILGSPQLCMLPAEFRVRCASAVDTMIAEAAQPPVSADQL
ncbi:hypothetical protein SFA35_10095 [Pseudomonas sp. HR96]|uniref:hypothetical protein n=1 Tax=Pseudomonas sp. HR96 TaxID=1027966 RepID=UPI002A75027C|nr:hypothetical protein [Pseudomonas sp. HR96]WPP01666.1 hypothetical protein SFA35_10095 [Pseudomonas sp. HR96]